LGFCASELRATASRLASAVGVDLQRLRSHADELSGGNQQKLAFGRSIGGDDPGVLLMNEPTRGVDVGARAEIYRLIRQFCDRGYCLVMASSDIEEVLGMADVIVSMYRGRQIAIYHAAKPTRSACWPTSPIRSRQHERHFAALPVSSRRHARLVIWCLPSASSPAARLRSSR
jgi:ABC-type sugar transport system ATPase subunit